MRKRVWIPLLLLSAFPLFAASEVYRSNDFGMQLEPIPSWRRNELKWVLEVTPKAGGEVRRLFQDGKEARRWETSSIADGRKEEREIAGGVVVTRRIYAGSGDLLEEDQYTKGKLAQRSIYTYASSRLARVRVLAADGTLEHANDYFYTSRGSLREVRQTGGKEGTRISSFVAGRSGPSEEWNQDGDNTYIARYDKKGRAVEREHRTGKELASQVEFAFREDTDKLLSSEEKLPGEGKVITRGYDPEGRLQTESTATGDKVTETITYVRDDKGRVTRKQLRSPAGLEEWRYALDEGGKTTREEFFRRGSLEKVTVYGANDSRVEELYQAGALFLKVYYEGDRRAREEVYSDGKVVRERSFN